MADMPSDMFTWASLGTLSGLTGATVVVTNTAAHAFAWAPRWLGLAVAFALCMGLTATQSGTASEYALASLNACLVYLTAAGASAAGAAAITPPRSAGGALESIDEGEKSSAFFHRWF